MSGSHFSEMRDGRIKTIGQAAAYAERLEPHIEAEHLCPADFKLATDRLKALKEEVRGPADSPVTVPALQKLYVIEVGASVAFERAAEKAANSMYRKYDLKCKPEWAL